MSPFFSDPYPDENFYSIIMRCHKYSGNFNIRITLNELMGVQANVSINMFPVYLDHLCRQIGNYYYTPDYFIYKHSIFPAYLPFLTKDKVMQIKNDMIFGKAVSIYMRIGEMAGGICRVSKARVCKKCMEEDRKRHGESYLHRIHQLPGNYFCNVHDELLEQVAGENVNELKSIDINSTHIDYEKFSFNQQLTKNLRTFSSDLVYLFNSDIEDSNLEISITKYRVMLYKKGYLSNGGILDITRLNRDLTEFYGNEFLNFLESNLSENFNWTNYILNGMRTVHFIRHLLFIRFLFGGIKEFSSFKDINYNPFGEGPWPCLNPACNSFNQDVISTNTISRRSKSVQPLGIFRCNICGYTYTRLGPDKVPEDKYKRRAIIDFGDVWLEALRSTVLKGTYSVYELARIMGCDGKTIGSYAKKLGIFHYLNSNMQVDEHQGKINRVDKSLKEKYLNDILDYISKNPSALRCDIQKNNMKQFIWLYRYERTLLESVLPRPRNKNRYLRKNRVESKWIDRDNKFLLSISECLIKFFATDVLSRSRLTINYISKHVVHYPVYKYLDKLPKTSKLLKDNIESIEEFQMKKIDACIKIMSANNEKITLNKVANKAGLQICKSEIKNYIQQAINLAEK